jgi:hypothetical protein
LFEKESVTKDNNTVEGEARLGTAPTDEFIDGKSIRLLGTRRCKRAQNGVFRLFQVGQPKYRFSP